MAYASERMDTVLDVDTPPLHLDDSCGTVKRYRSIFLSDIHLGTVGCKAEAVLRFLDEYQANRLYLLGDIMDVWSNDNIFTWPKEQIAVLRRILGMAEKGVDVYYILGNHDRALGKLTGADLGALHIRREFVYETADKRRVLLTHGDAYDGFVMKHEWVARLATRAYHFITVFNDVVNRMGRSVGRIEPVNICRQVRTRSKQFTNAMSGFTSVVSEETRRRECDGVICGHMHSPEVGEIGGVQYYNVGDWVEHCTALVEDFTGNLDLIHYDMYPETAAARTPAAETGATPVTV
jgi:UDP-2,3-diacylglucosamine pyrophosphatase LpxH